MDTIQLTAAQESAVAAGGFAEVFVLFAILAVLFICEGVAKRRAKRKAAGRMDLWREINRKREAA